jgi:hypothetical protein
VTNDEAAYVERVAQMLYAGGLPRMAGRIWGWLLVCEPPQQTAGQLADELQASRGSISAMARLLENAGLISRGTKPGDRREHFSVPPNYIVGVLESRLPATIAWRELADDGLAFLADRPPASRARLSELRDLYAFMERELPALIERYRLERAAAAGRDGANRQPDPVAEDAAIGMERTA